MRSVEIDPQELMIRSTVTAAIEKFGAAGGSLSAEQATLVHRRVCEMREHIRRSNPPGIALPVIVYVAVFKAVGEALGYSVNEAHTMLQLDFLSAGYIAQHAALLRHTKIPGGHRPVSAEQSRTMTRAVRERAEALAALGDELPLEEALHAMRETGAGIVREVLGVCPPGHLVN